MKKTNQTNAQKFRLEFLKTLVLTSVMCGSANVASAQTDARQLTNSSVQSKQQYCEQQQTSEQKPQPVPVEKRTQIIAVDSKPVTAVKNTDEKPVDVTVKQTQPVTMDQLRLQKKQASDKGLPTDEYDNAIKNRIKNQTN